MPRGGRKHQKKHAKAAVPVPDEKTGEPEIAEEECLQMMDAYNFADTIQTDWEASEVPSARKLTVQWFPAKKPASGTAETMTAVPEDDVASETESIVDLDTLREREEKLNNPEPESCQRHEDRVNDDEEEDLEDFYMWPKAMDSVIYSLTDELDIVRFLMNKPERKVYFARRKSDDEPVVVIVGQEFDPRLRDAQGVPREVSIMKHLRGQKNVAEILGWCRVDSRHFVMVLRHYRSADMVDSSGGNIFIISKMMESILQGIKQVHDSKVVHRDIAKSNILWNPLTDTATIIDFDNATFYRPTGYYRNVGRDRYDAPEKTEMLEIRSKLKDRMYSSEKKTISTRKVMRAYTEKADLYSVGVILWMLLNEKHHSPSPYKLKNWVTKMKQRNKHKKFAELDLLVKLLNFDPERRISVDDALKHPFIVNRPKDDRDYTHMKAYLFKQLNMTKEYDQIADKIGLGRQTMTRSSRPTTVPMVSTKRPQVPTTTTTTTAVKAAAANLWTLGLQTITTLCRHHLALIRIATKKTKRKSDSQNVQMTSIQLET